MKVERVSEEKKAHIRDLIAKGLTTTEIANAVKVSRDFVTQLAKKEGLTIFVAPRARASIPADFTERVAELRTFKAIRAHYGCGYAMLKTWVDATGVTLEQAKTGPRPVDLPAGWFELAPTMTVSEASRHFGHDVRTLRQMEARSGVKFVPFDAARAQRERAASKPKAPKPEAPKAEVASPKPKTQHKAFAADSGGRAHRSQWADRTPMSEADSAAHFLRRFFSNVHRADIVVTATPRRTWGFLQGLEDGGAGLYRVGRRGVMSVREMIALARERGWGASECTIMNLT